MKVFKAQFDATIITLIASSFDDAIILLKEKDSAFFTDTNGTLKYRWDDKYSDFVDVNEQKNAKRYNSLGIALMDSNEFV